MSFTDAAAVSAAYELPPFAERHIGPSGKELGDLLRVVGFESLDQLVDAAVPDKIRLRRPLNLPPGGSEAEVLDRLQEIAQRNQVAKSYIGLGYYGTVTPAVIRRNILENPGWYTAYTPYQAEIAQGRLEALANFQTMVTDLTGLEIANASLLDEATAAAEAMAMCHAAITGAERRRFFVSELCHPQTIAVLQTRAQASGIELVIGDSARFQWDASFFGGLLQYPGTDGLIIDDRRFIAAAHDVGALVVVATDLLALTLLTSPGELGADVAVGSSQRFGVPLGFGGPHAAFFATRDKYRRYLPGRLVGLSKDAAGRSAYRLALQTREQHIRRDKATSNICTAQVLLAVIASTYAVYHGPERLRAIAHSVAQQTRWLAQTLIQAGYEVPAGARFDTIWVRVGERHASILEQARRQLINLRIVDGETFGISLDETVTVRDLQRLVSLFGVSTDTPEQVRIEWPDWAQRKTGFLNHPVFNRYHTETELMRYLKRLENRDLSLTTSMIPLGSCTMKLNAAAEMLPVTWPEFSQLHPFAPAEQTRGYAQLITELEDWLGEITGFDAISTQPNAGSQGEFAGLLAIRAYHESRGQGHRNICLIPTSAHGTNPASAAMAGFRVVPVACDSEGNIDVQDLRRKAQEHADDLGVLMVTYPSTHGVFEEAITDICAIIHELGGQVYLDGANLNAQVGLCRPGDYGADVCHLNLHKTFCIPHGGGGPGVGPIGVKSHLVSFLPGHPVSECLGSHTAGPVSAAPFGSASILTISWVYISLMGSSGLTQASKVAILNANYVARRLSQFYPVLYKGRLGLIAHECIVDLRQFKRTAAIEVEDVAKRLMDYGFHAPTMSWPVPGTLMIEPTESESKAELDRFCDALISIHGEIRAIETGESDRNDNALKHAPHTVEDLLSEDWRHAYSRESAAYPAAWLRHQKFWPVVSRIDNVYGDRNLFCSCAPVEEFA